MSIIIERIGVNLYIADVTPPHAKTRQSIRQAVDGRTLFEKLQDLGCHPVDISDSFYEAYSDWLQELDRPRDG